MMSNLQKFGKKFIEIMVRWFDWLIVKTSNPLVIDSAIKQSNHQTISPSTNQLVKNLLVVLGSLPTSYFYI